MPEYWDLSALQQELSEATEVQQVANVLDALIKLLMAAAETPEGE